MFVKPTVFEMHTLTIEEQGRFPGMSGVRIERDQDGTARAIATDGRQITIAEWEEPIEKDDQTSPGFAAAIPVSYAKQLAKHKPKTRKPKLDCVEFDENTKDDTKAIAKLRDLESSTEKAIPAIEGLFPNWKELVRVQKEPLTVVDIDFDTLTKVLATVKKHVTDEERILTIGIAGYDQAVSIFAKDNQGNRIASYIAVKAHDGPDLKPVPTKQVWRFPESIKPIPAETSEPQAEPSNRQAEIDQDVLLQLTADLAAARAELSEARAELQSKQEAGEKILTESAATVKRLEERAATADRIRESQVKVIAELKSQLEFSKKYDQENGKLTGQLEQAEQKAKRLQEELVAAVDRLQEIERKPQAASYLPADKTRQQPLPAEPSDHSSRKRSGKLPACDDMQAAIDYAYSLADVFEPSNQTLIVAGNF